MIRLIIIVMFYGVMGLAPRPALSESSFGPGKGPAIPGTGKSKYTHPQPPKRTPYNPTSIRPAFEVPEKPELFTWRLTSKVDGRDPPKPTSEVPIYSFGGGRKSLVGMAKSGDEFVFDEMRPVGKAHYYKYAWPAAPKTAGPTQEYWVSGSNVEYAGKK